ncbi:Protein CBG25759 [Caenorhabditis briggsae]|uniref:Protein CBG25759 n=1 Tax=Caenorhabditis briggsae TaxID=6238 RepID=B6IHT0_CAEBR|nr:Protein CBG25759 [Caenorhabditis briggsae]CAR99460.1 Protein CBG25759 [Caenorhabditis briggsae]
MINLKELQLYYQNNLNFVDVAAWNVESCFITTMDDQVSLRDLNRFFKLWTKESNPKLKEFFVHWNTEIVPDWNVLLKGLKGIVKYALEEEILYIIRNNRGISAEIKIDHYDGDKASVVFLLSD